MMNELEALQQASYESLIAGETLQGMHSGLLDMDERGFEEEEDDELEEGDEQEGNTYTSDDGVEMIQASRGNFVRNRKRSEKVVLKDGTIFIDNERRSSSKLKCNLEILKPRPNIKDGLATEFKKQANPNIIQACFRNDVPMVGSRLDFFFAGTWFRQPICSPLAQILKAWVPALPALQRYSERVPSELQALDASGGPLGDGISKVKVRYQSDGFWRDVSSDDYGPFLTDAGGLAAPSIYRAINNEYNLKCPESENPDSKIIPDPWEKPKKESTKHADIPDELKAVLLDYFRAHRDSNELLQTNFFYGDNDNAQPQDSLDYVSKLKVACERETRPSVNEIMKALSGVARDTLPAFTDSLGNQRPEMVVPFERDVFRDSRSRTVKEIEWEKVFAKRIEEMSAEEKGKYAENNSPIYTPPIRKWAKLRFATSDNNVRGGKHRGELLTIESDNGVEYGARDRARKSKIFFTKEQLKQIKDGTAYRYANLCRENGVNAADVSKFHVKPLSKADKAKQWADKAQQAKLWYAGYPKTPPDPALLTASMTVDEARAIHGVKPANDNRIYSGLPWKLWRPDYLVIKPDTPSPLLADSPEEFFIENHSRENILAAKSELSADEVLVLDSFMSSESLAKLGSKTGDEGKHERTQERNAKRRLLEVAAKYSAILDKIAA